MGSSRYRKFNLVTVDLKKWLKNDYGNSRKVSVDCS